MVEYLLRHIRGAKSAYCNERIYCLSVCLSVYHARISQRPRVQT